MNSNKVIVFFTVLLGFMSPIKAQNSPEFEGITKAKLEDLTIRHLKLLQKSLEIITSDGLTASKREKEIAFCRKLFTPDALIETKGLNNYKKEWKVSDYLQNIGFPPEGTNIDISFFRDPEITAIKKIDHKTYQITGNLLQRFRKEKVSGKTYEDITVKTALVKIEQVMENEKPVYQIKIIRINADQVWKP